MVTINAYLIIYLDISQTKDDGEQQHGGEDGHSQEHDKEVAADKVEVVLLILVGNEDCGENKAEGNAELLRDCQHPSAVYCQSLIRRLNEGSRRFHNHGEGPY